MELVGLRQVSEAAQRLTGGVVRTPVVPCPWADGEFWVKPENLQPTGAFKIRGATNAVALLDGATRARGVVTHSSGNHGQALAHAARALGARCTVVAPEGASPVKVEAMRAMGARVVTVPPERREETARALAAEEGAALVPPFDHPDVIAGQGTVGLEIVADLPEVDVVLVPVGGGGLASGVATAVTALRPSARVVGVEPEAAADTAEGLALGRRTVWASERTRHTIADGVRVGNSELTFAHLRERLDSVVTVGEAQIRAAMGVLARRARLVAEPSGALATAAYLSGRTPRGRTVAVVSGGNADPWLLAEVLTAAVRPR
ncbi:threonine/serine dehydratase [Thermobifida halotolerans]|uniref:threonine ammonia-lyase n=1 Tax=Thermobifida halotolerans TaxID=483545 RepID=A0AA97M0H0_9ACTN|nr:threonine/serine dehydratase [Thermobifida halotolerans]UOE21545.1 threonine/serine dehydratase [Thermobifida halotolerans]